MRKEKPVSEIENENASSKLRLGDENENRKLDNSRMKIKKMMKLKMIKMTRKNAS